MELLQPEIQEHFNQVDRFLICFDRATSHVYGLVKAAFVEVKDRVIQHHTLIRDLWETPSSRTEIIQSANNALRTTRTTKGELPFFSHGYHNLNVLVRGR